MYEALNNHCLCQLNHLQVQVDILPIGGFRGKVGSLIIQHVDYAVFTDWSDDDLKDLAELIQRILKIQEDAQVTNCLIFAKQQAHDFKLSLVPYPKCDWMEKVMGAIHVIFGSPQLDQKQMDEIRDFYQGSLSQKLELPAELPPEQKQTDAFCKPEIIHKQQIAHLTFEVEKETFAYDLLHDNRPKGPSINDPHLLIVPEGISGHKDGSSVKIEQRFHMLQTVRKAMKIFLQESYSTLLFLERNGSQLQGVQHKHSHAMGISEFPQSFFQKICALLRLVWSSALSQDELAKKITHYQGYTWK